MFLKHTKWALLWALVILILCGMPGKDIPHISFLELLNFDKFVHAGIFFVLALLTIKGFIAQTTFSFLKGRPQLITIVICILYGGLLEIMQGTLFNSRSADVYDFIANSFGAIISIPFYSSINKYFLSRITFLNT